MRSTRVLLLGLLVSAVLWNACGSGSMSPVVQNKPPAPADNGTATVSLTMGDTPPAGVTILSFELKVTAAVLNPHDPTHSPVSLLAQPVEVEIKRLEIERAFLNTASVPADTYDSITVTFANPQLTILNTSSGPIAGCAAGTVCKLEPPLGPASVTVSSAPFPLDLTGNSQAGLLLDFNLNDSIQVDLSIQPSVSFTQLALVPGDDKPQPEEEMDEIEDVAGQVTAVDVANQQFTFLNPLNGQTLAIQVNDATRFEDFDEAGLANTFAALAVGQVVEVDLTLMTGGSLVAKRVELRHTENEVEDEFEGTVVAVDSPTQIKMIVVSESDDSGTIQVGDQVTVTLESGAQFRIDDDGLTVPSDLVFASAADLLVGQNVQVRAASGSSGAAVTTDRVRLRRSRFTAAVAAISDSNFSVNSLPGYFGMADPPITQIDVRSTSETDFEDVSGISGLAVGNTVSLRGLLFKTSGNPLLLADTVRKR